MGIRFASGRHTNVVVMAPALTETAQTQNFKFVTSPSRSPSLSLKNHLKKKSEIQAEEVHPKLSNGLSNFTGMNGHSPVSKTTYSINGLAKNLKNEFLPLNQKKEEAVEKCKSDANYSITQIGGYMMNSGFMGDPDMGLQKSSKDLCEGEKMSPEVDQLLKNLGVMNSEELSSNSELPQNVEEIFKVISTQLETNTNEIESGPSGDNMFPDMSAALSSFERGLFNDVDIMNMCVDETLVAVNKDTLIRDRIDEIRKRQFQVGRKCDFLMRRLRKIKARTLGKHAAEEITGVIEYSSNLLEASSRLRGYSSGDIDSDIKCDIKSVSYSNMSLFMRQMEHAVNQQTNNVARNSIRQCKYFGSGSATSNLISTSNGVRSSLPGSVLPPFPAKVQRELASTSGELKAQLVKIQQDIDSDVTESSSGCESCDEFITYNNSHQHQLSISKRASWKWAQERAAMAAKWIWVQSQIVDLDYKIRQQGEIKKSLRARKTAPKFEGEPKSSVTSPNSETEGSCSRTRGLVKNSFARRKLHQVHGLHRISKKAARSATLRCSCSTSLPGCGLCTGRAEPGQAQEPICALPISERVAFLDPGFHPVLSFPQDVCASVHYDAVMKCTDWQSRASRIQGKASTSTSLTTEEKTPRGRPPSNDHQVVDLQRSKAAALAVSDKLRRKLVRGKRRRRTANLTLDRYRHRRKHSTGLSGVDSEEAVEQDIEAGVGSRYPSPVPSPASVHAPTVSKDKDVSLKVQKEGRIPLNQRKRENSYDIDNIVIPYSMASSTRLEKLNYKEILTPKWRIVQRKESFDDSEQRNGIIRRSSHENAEVEEENSDEAAIARHDRCQIDEKKRFLSYLKLPGGLSRGRAQRRTDSRADSSGPNTPDGMSPRDDGTASLEDPTVITSPPQNSCDNETGRRRTISNSQLPPVISEVEPYEPRKFPLSEEAYKKLKEANGPQQPTTNNSSYQNSAAPVSPGSVSTDSADSFFGEDPNDPEWTTHATVERTNCKR